MEAALMTPVCHAVRPLSPLRADPSRTTTLRARLLAEMNRRFKELQADIQQLVAEDDVFGLIDRPLTTHAASIPQHWQFLTDDRKVTQFLDWLQKRIDDKVLQVPAGQDAFTAKYIESAYKKGVVRSWVDAKKAEGAVSGTQAEFLKSSFGSAEAVGKLRLLQTRAYEGLRGVTTSMSTTIARTLADGLVRGDHPQQIAKALVNATGISLARARTLARTEIMHAHAEGQLDAFDALHIEGLMVLAEWMTAGDDRVCPLCSAMEGTVYTIAEARGLIPKHPNCRCTWVPADVYLTANRVRTRIQLAVYNSLLRLQLN